MSTETIKPRGQRSYLPVFIATGKILAALFSILSITLPTAWAHHESINPIHEKSSQGVYIEGDDITTRLMISTGNIDNSHEVTSQNETMYYVTVRDIYADKPETSPEPYKATLFIPALKIINHNYTRQLSEGLWTINVEVITAADRGDDILLLNTSQSILVKGREFAVFERQAQAEEQNALLTEENLRITQWLQQ